MTYFKVMLFYLDKINKGVVCTMEKDLQILKDKVQARKKAWKEAKDPVHVTSIFVCERRIQKLNEALEMIDELESIAEYSKIQIG